MCEVGGGLTSFANFSNRPTFSNPISFHLLRYPSNNFVTGCASFPPVVAFSLSSSTLIRFSACVIISEFMVACEPAVFLSDTPFSTLTIRAINDERSFLTRSTTFTRTSCFSNFSLMFFSVPDTCVASFLYFASSASRRRVSGSLGFAGSFLSVEGVPACGVSNGKSRER